MTKITRVLSKYAIENTPEHMFVHNGFTQRHCSACQNVFIPNEGDISTRRPSTFCKTCKRYRDRYRWYRKNKELRDVQKYIDALD